MWLLRLYPRAWRDRYGEEMSEWLREARWTPSLVVDLVAGAVDARLNPRLAVPRSTGGSSSHEDRAVSPSTVFRRRCMSAGPYGSARDQRRRTAVTLGGAAALTAIWMWAAVTFREPEARQYVLAFVQLPLFTGLIAAMPFGPLRGRARATQAIVMSVCLTVLVVWCAVVGFVASAL